MGYAEVSVNSPIAQHRAFSYAIPPDLTIDVGQAVWVPFGDKLLQGIVLELSDYPSVEETREITGIIDSHPVLSPAQVKLTRWVSEHYLSPLFEAVALMLPPGFKRKAVTFISIPSFPREIDILSLTQEQKKFLELVQTRGKINLRELGRKLGSRQAKLTTSQLVRQGLIVKSYELEKAKVKPKTVPYLRLVVKADEARQQASRLREKQAIKQAALLGFLVQQAEPITLSEIRQTVGISASIVKAVVDKGLVEVQHIEIKRDPLACQSIPSSYPLTLTAAQRSALESIKSSLLTAPSENV
jgi:primosomal protein N' (replication factor Y)